MGVNNQEAPTKGGFEIPAGTPDLINPLTSELVRGVIERTVQPHELPPALHALWRDGFHAGAEKVRSRLRQAEADAARYYYEAYNSDEAKSRHRQMLTEFQVALNRKSTAERWAELDRIATARSEANR